MHINKVLLVLLLLTQCAFAQIDNSLSIQKHRKYGHFNKIQESYTLDNYFDQNRNKMGLTPKDDMRLIKSETDRFGITHNKYAQFYKGVPVFGATYILHENQNKIVSANGYFLPFLDISVLPTVVTSKIQGIVKKYIESNQEELGEPDGFKIINSSLVIVDAGFERFTGNYKLCYFSEVEFDNGHRLQYFIDAHNAKVVNVISAINHHGVPGQIETNYYGIKNITVDSISENKYHLFDPTRGVDGISVFSYVDTSYISSSSPLFEFGEFDLRRSAGEVMYGTQSFYDLLKKEFDWLGVDNNNRSFNANILGASRFVNAYWNGEDASFGIGDCRYGALTTIDIVGHEYMHGIIQETSDLVYLNEAGGINESLADIMGVTLEYIYEPQHFNWILADQILLEEGLDPFRNMKDPESLEQPAVYKGNFWNDYLDVHESSAIGNKWFQILSEGEISVNSSGSSYDVDSMGVLETAKFVFYVNRFYLPRFTDYNSFYLFSIEAAKEYFSDDQQIINNIKEAWNAVGLPSENYEGYLDLALSSDKVSVCSVGDSVPVEFYLKNVGAIDYNPAIGDRVTVTVEFNEEEQTIEYPIVQSIMAGDSIHVVYDKLLVEATDDDIRVVYRLYVTDAITNNNFVWVQVGDAFIGPGDLRLQVSLTPGECGDFSQSYRIRIRNIGCKDISKEEDYVINIKNKDTGQLLWEAILNSEDDLLAGYTFRTDTILNLGFEESTNLLFELKYEKDPNLENNTTEIVGEIKREIGPDYYNDFNDTLSLNKDIDIQILNSSTYTSDTSYRFNHIRLYEYENESWFYATGSDEEAEQICEKFDPWDEYDRTSIIAACVDMTNNLEPIMAFNLVQITNRDDSINNVLDCALKISWDGLATKNFIEVKDSILITDQVDFQIYRREIPLPSEFVGDVIFNFRTATGIEDFKDDFLEYDVFLMDNLHFLEPVSSYNSLEENKVVLYPNPVIDILELNSENELQRVEIYDINGSMVLSIADKRLKYIYMGNLYSGVYFVKLLRIDEKESVHRVVKI